MRREGRLVALAVLATGCSGGAGGRGGDDLATETVAGTLDTSGTASTGADSASPEDTGGDPTGAMTTATPTTTSMPGTGDDSGGSSDDGVPGSCGDGNRDPAEACDDGDATEADGCNSDCTVSGSVLWSHVSAGGSDQSEDGYGVAVASDGAAFVAGDRVGTTRDLMLRGYTAEGGLDFTVVTDGPSAGADSWYALAIDGSTLYAAGSHDNAGNDAFVASYGTDGTAGWTHSLVDPLGGSDVAYAITVDAPGNIIVAGATPVDLEGTNAFVRKLTPVGGESWTQLYTSADAATDEAHGVAADFAGNVVAVGFQAVGGQIDMFVRKYDPSGAPLWTQAFAGVDGLDDRAHAVACDANGDIVVVGHETSAATGALLWVRRYDLNGNEVWTQTFAGAAGEGAAGHGVAIDAAGDIAVVGRETVGGLDRVLVRKYAAEGSVRWSETIEGAARTSSIGRAITVGPDEHLWISAGVDKGVDARDVYIAKIAR